MMKPSVTQRELKYHPIRGVDKGTKFSTVKSNVKKLTRKRSTGKIKTVKI